MNTAIPVTRAYDVRVDYLSDGERFAADRFTLEVAVGLDPYKIAYTRTNRSVYADPRVPDLQVTLAILSVEPDDFEADPPADPSQYLCPRCEIGDATREVRSETDLTSPAAPRADISDLETCMGCGPAKEAIASLVPIGSCSAADKFMWALIDLLQDGELAFLVEFQLFCLANAGTLTIRQAALAWHSRPRRA